MPRIDKSLAVLGAALAFAAGAGFLVSAALGVGAAAPPTETVTVNIPTTAAPGAECPAGSTFKAVLFNAPGGQTTIYACVRNS